MTKERNYKLNTLIVFAAAAVLRIICYLQPVAFRFRSDDFGPVTYAAGLAGYDWRPFSAHLNNYYGYGYYWIFAPFFRLIDSPETLLIVMTVCNSLVMVLSSVLIYRLLVKYFSFPEKLYTVVFALLPAMFQGDPKDGRYWYRTDNEIPLFIACWLTVWIILKANEELQSSAGTRMKIAAAAALIICWGLTVHERTMALMLAVIFAEVFLYFAKKKWLFHPQTFFITLAAGYIGQRMLRKFIISVMWLGGAPERNTSAFSRVSLWFLESFTAFKALIMVFIGNMHKLMIRGFGIPAIALVLVTIWVVKQLPVLRSRFFSKDEDVVSEWTEPSMLIMLVFGMSILITVAGIAVRWGVLLYPGLDAGEVVYGYKGICYVRYYFTFMGPVILASLVWIGNHMPVKRNMIAAIAGVLAVIEVIFYAWIYPYCTGADAEAGTNYARRALGMYLIPDCSLKTGMTISILLMAAVTICVLAASAERKRPAAARGLLAAAAAIALLAFAADRVTEMDPANTSLSLGSAEKATAILDELRAEDVFPDKVYLQVDTSNNWSYGTVFMNKDMNVEGGDPDPGETDGSILVLRSVKKTSYYKKMGFKGVNLKPFYAYTNDKDIAKVLKEYRTEQDEAVEEKEGNDEE